MKTPSNQPAFESAPDKRDFTRLEPHLHGEVAR